MPTYEFACQNCGTVFDVRASISEKEKGLHPVCPECGNQVASQVISAGMFIRGGGGNPIFNPPGCGPAAGPECCG